MEFKKFFSSYNGMLLENRLNSLVLVLLQRNQTVVLVPPEIISKSPKMRWPVNNFSGLGTENPNPVVSAL